MNIIAYGGTNWVVTPQITNIYLEDYSGKTITKQNLLDLLLTEIWDDRDGEILRHINNVDVLITRKSDNVLINNIVLEGYYDIRMSCKDSDDNIGTDFWQNINLNLNTNVLTLYVRQNQAPTILINEKRIFLLSDYSGVIDRTILNSELIYKVIDDRDGIIPTDITNIQIFQTGVESTSGVPPVYGTSGLLFIPVIPPLELLYIDQVGEYIAKITVVDSDNAKQIANYLFDVFII